MQTEEQEIQGVLLQMRKAQRVNYLKVGALLILLAIGVGLIGAVVYEVPRLVHEVMGVPYEP